MAIFEETGREWLEYSSGFFEEAKEKEDTELGTLKLEESALEEARKATNDDAQPNHKSTKARSSSSDSSEKELAKSCSEYPVSSIKSSLPRITSNESQELIHLASRLLEPNPRIENDPKWLKRSTIRESAKTQALMFN